MPTTFTHDVFGKDVWKLLPKQLKGIIRENEEVYRIGLHGPDILFYYKPLTHHRVNQLGYLLHKRNASVFFRKSLAILQKMPDPEAGLAYLLGFICHFALDSECHGYIEYKIKHSNMTHTEIESDFDRKLLRDGGYNPKRTCLTSHICPREGDTETIAMFFPSLREKHIQKALSSMVFYNKLLLAPTQGKRDYVLSLLRITGHYKEIQGLLMPEYPRPGCEDSTRELTRRYKNGIPIAVWLCENYYNTFCEMDVLSSRFHRTYGPDEVEMKKYENGVSQELLNSLRSTTL